MCKDESACITWSGERLALPPAKSGVRWPGARVFNPIVKQHVFSTVVTITICLPPLLETSTHMMMRISAVD